MIKELPETQMLIIEDDDQVRSSLKRRLVIKHRYSPENIREADQLIAALDLITKLVGAGVPFIAFVDGNLKSSRTSGEDGENIIEAIRTQALFGVSIGYSGSIPLNADVKHMKQDVDQIDRAIESAEKLLLQRKNGANLI